MVPGELQAQNHFSFFDAFEWQVWLALCLTGAGVGAVLYVVERSSLLNAAARKSCSKLLHQQQPEAVPTKTPSAEDQQQQGIPAAVSSGEDQSGAI